MNKLRGLIGVAIAWAALMFSAVAGAQETKHYRFAHDQQLNSGYSIAYDIFSAKLFVRLDRIRGKDDRREIVSRIGHRREQERLDIFVVEVEPDVAFTVVVLNLRELTTEGLCIPPRGGVQIAHWNVSPAESEQ